MVSKIKKPKAIKKVQPVDNFKLLDDREHVRLRSGMYIPNKDYCIYELVDNGVDILVNDEISHLYSKKEIQVMIDNEGIITVTDSAGALPTEESDEVPGCSVAELCMSRLKAGTKFEEGVKSAGLNGVGASCINFLSEWFYVEIHNGSESYSMNFKQGVIDKKLELIGTQSPDFRMTLIQCKPDPEIWDDKDDFNIPSINNRMKQICYLNPELTIKVDIEYGDHDIHEVYNYPDGVKSYVEELTANKNSIHDPWFLENKNIKMGTKTYKEPIHDKEDPNLIIGYNEIEKDIFMDLSVAFVYTDSYSDTIYAFTNNVINTDGKSSNITGFKRGIAAAVKDCFENEYPKSKTQLTAEDTREGIVAVVSVKVPDPNYIGQGKDYLNMPIIASILYSEIKEFCEDQFDKLPNDKDNILNKVIESNKIREAAHKAKEAARKNKNFANKKVEKLVKCASKDPEACEVFLVEGDSAASTATTACDKNTQAILPVFGKIPNVEEMTLDKVLSSDKLKDILYSLECGIGEDFNIDNLRYHKIIIMSDADVDGYHIATLYITLFYRYFRPIIEEGYLYLSCPPLYKIIVDKNTTLYAIDDAELNSIKQQYPNKKLNITYLKGLGELSAEGLWDSTMNPEHRTLIKITIEDAEEANKIVSMCMNSKVMNTEKRQYIMSEEDYTIL